MGLPFLFGECMRHTITVLLAAANLAQAAPLTLEQLRTNTVVQEDCPRSEELIAKLEANQRQAGIPHSNPEDLPEPAREYQSLTRINIWALRIGCANPNRYVLSNNNVVKKQQTNKSI
jgi:hypothetical protein